MEAVIFVGIQATGKSTFYKERFFDTHVRINLDMLRTRNRERLILEACLEAKQKFVLDNTNLTRENRAKYVEKAKSHHFKVVAYYFRTELKKAVERNSRREGAARIPEKGLFAARKRLQIPRFDEGFDELFDVWINEESKFVIENSKEAI